MTIKSIEHNPEVFKSCFDWNKSSHDDSYRYPFFKIDPPPVMRLKFAKLSAAALFGIPLLRFPSRCFFLITGSWALAGYEKANKIWKRQCIAMTCSPSPLSYKLIGLCITKELISDITKCATLPLALIAILFSSLWGMANPDDGRKLIGRVEKLWSIQLPKWANRTRMFEVVNILGICFQDLETWRELNIFRYAPKFNPHTLRSLLLNIEKLHEDGLGHIDQFDAKRQSWRNQISGISLKDSLEIDENGNLLHLLEESNVKEALINLLRAHEELNEAIFCEANKGLFLSDRKRANLDIAISKAVDEVHMSLNLETDLLEALYLE